MTHTKNITIHMDAALRTEIIKRAASQNMTIKDYLTNILERDLKAKGGDKL